MRSRLTALLLLLGASAALRAQAPKSRSAMFGAFAGAGSGPVPSGLAGVEASVGVLPRVRLGAEAGAWFNGPVACIQLYPESLHCSTSGSGYLAQVQFAPAWRSVAPTLQALGGVYVRRGDASPALGGTLGLRLGDAHGVAGHIGVRYLRVLDRGYERLLQEKLQFTMLTLGVQHYW